MEKGKFYKGVGSRYYKLLEKGKEIGTDKVLYTLLDLYGKQRTKSKENS